MTGRLTSDAFARYVALGVHRSYSRIAEEFGVSKRAVTKHAAKHGWSDRLAAIETDAQRSTDVALAESLEAMNGRHLKTLRAIQGKALDALRGMPLGSALDAVRTITLAIKEERAVRNANVPRLVVPEPNEGEREEAEGSA